MLLSLKKNHYIPMSFFLDIPLFSKFCIFKKREKDKSHHITKLTITHWMNTYATHSHLGWRNWRRELGNASLQTQTSIKGEKQQRCPWQKPPRGLSLSHVILGSHVTGLSLFLLFNMELTLNGFNVLGGLIQKPCDNLKIKSFSKWESTAFVWDQ